MPGQEKSQRETDLLKRLQSMFRIEAEERLRAMSSGMLELEKTPAADKQTEIIETIFREAHSLKGAARAVNMIDIEAICQSLETVLAGLKRKKIKLSPALFDTLHHAADTISKLLFFPEGSQTPVTELMQQLASLEAAGQSSDSPAEQYTLPAPENIPPDLPGGQSTGTTVPAVGASDHNAQLFGDKPAVSETVRISTAKLDSLLLQAEEILSIKLAAGQHAADLRNIKNMLDLWDKEWAKILPGLQTGKTSFQSAKILEFLDWNYINFKLLENKVKTLAKSVEHYHRILGGIADNLLKDMKKVLMLPFSSLLETFPKMVRDLSRAQGKEIELVMHGSDVEIDRRILEEMKDPLIHLLRNSIDHGIEKPEEREQNKKPRRGTVTIAISQINAQKVEIAVSDDGAGINLDKVKESAVKRGFLSEKEREGLSVQEALALIFQSEVSTSPIITDISGRGLGLAIVREKVEKLGGLISVETQPQAGSSFRIQIPITLATFRGIIVRASEQLFVIPTINVERVMRIKQDEIKTVQNKETISLNGRTVSFVMLADVLELPRQEKKKTGSRFIQVLVFGTSGKQVVFGVDEILNEQEVLVKSLGKQLARVRNIAGATILGSGKVIPILNVPDLLKSAAKVRIPPAGEAVAAREVSETRKSILVVEDSITSRMLLKNILESAGYHVKTAVDGVEALTALKMEDYDLVVTDIEMPRMNGFDLTARIRADKKLSQMPVILVTGLGSREDRERGIDAGADAYILKSSFDHSNLLETIKRLI